MFDVQQHIKERKKRSKKASIENPKLLGLTTLEINPTELCNRTCSFCPRHDPEIYPNRNLNMTAETAQVLADQLVNAAYDGEIHITGFGEPMLTPDILKITEVFASRFYTEIISNGDRLLSRRVKIEDLEATGLQRLTLDAYDGKAQVKKFQEMLKDVKMETKIREHEDTGEEDLIEKYNYNNRGGMMGDIKSPFERPCYLPFYKAFVDWDGAVRLCCNDWARRQESFGNILERPFDEIWMSDIFQKVRKKLFVGERKQLAACKNCSVNGTMVGGGSAELWDKMW